MILKLRMDGAELWEGFGHRFPLNAERLSRYVSTQDEFSVRSNAS